MDLDPMINISQNENDYSDYDNRPIRPMDQDALNEALARLPILADEDDSMSSSDPNIRYLFFFSYSKPIILKFQYQNSSPTNSCLFNKT
jgi:hypothetical protein